MSIDRNLAKTGFTSKAAMKYIKNTIYNSESDVLVRKVKEI